MRSRKSLKLGSYSIVISLAAIVIAVILNVGFSKLPSTVREIDLSGKEMITLSDQSKQIVKTLQNDVTLMHVVQTGFEDAALESLLHRYEAAGKRVKVVGVDPDERPTLSSEYGITTLYNNSVIVESGIRHVYIPYNEIYVTTIEYISADGDDYQSTTTFEGEKAITSAIQNVSRETLPKAYFISGHDETPLEETYRELMKRANVDMAELVLSGTKSVPEDASFVVLLNPARDVSEKEEKALETYLSGGGTILLLTTPTNILTDRERPNIERLAAYMGMAEKTGIVVESDQSYYYAGAGPIYLVPDLVSGKITDPLIQYRYSVLLPYAGALIRTEAEGVTYQTLAKTSGSSFLKSGDTIETLEREQGDETGSFDVMALSEKTLSNGKIATLLWVASPFLPSSTLDMYSNGANYDLFRNAVNYLAGDADAIAIGVKIIDTPVLSPTSAQSTIWTIVLIALVVLTAATGVFVLIKRNLK